MHEGKVSLVKFKRLYLKDHACKLITRFTKLRDLKVVLECLKEEHLPLEDKINFSGINSVDLVGHAYKLIPRLKNLGFVCVTVRCSQEEYLLPLEISLRCVWLVMHVGLSRASKT
eukprot:GHVN01011531.1.p1 GENE.GHVN01011531.1~~GHVN01011531.1.p1  ORF type:complete len:115 (-),score=9.83 GHVN01011531.1:54-398(-)